MSLWQWDEPPEPPPDWCDHDDGECDGDCHPPRCRCPECDPDRARDEQLDNELTGQDW